MRLHRVAFALGVVGVLAWTAPARAEADRFGIGDGHSGAKSIAADTEVNSYAGVTKDIAAGATTIDITAATLGKDGAAFAAKDLVLVWRATGVDAAEAPSGDRTKRLDLAKALATTSSGLSAGAVGRYEFARIKSIAGSTLTLEAPMVNAFAKTVTQVVRVPEYTTVNIAAGANLRAVPWQEVGGNPSQPNPTKQWVGGIVIFLAQSTITNAGTIHANGRGFHGATPIAHNLNSLGLLCDSNALDGDPTATNNAFTPKGEGVVQSKFTAQSGGKGNISMAGGGGDCLESGGGGGANSGNGGSGSATALNAQAGGLGGVGIDYDLLTRLTMGGGGGSGRHIVGLASQVSFGGFGGGVVYIRAASLVGKGSIQSNGANGEDSGIVGLPTGVASEGSGGGGAGGSIVVRLTGDLDCDQLGSTGGNGGNAVVVGLPILGAGGGGGGGRILFQAASKPNTCTVTVAPGNGGNQQGGGAQGGGVGTTVPGVPNPLCVPGAPGAPGNCANPKPVCDPISGNCVTCSGPFGGGPPNPCPVATAPVCEPATAANAGNCVPCKGDFGTGAADACQLATTPTCFPDGSCQKCTQNVDCKDPVRNICETQSGACGKGCTQDSDCASTEWCATATGGGVCVPKVPNGQPLPPNPPINGECTPANGQRTCLSAVCEESDDLCGLKNSSPCGKPDECRSTICFPGDKECGLPNGQPCSGNGQCRSDQCENGTCTGKTCGSDTDCPAPGQVCDPNTKTCVDGCRPGLTAPPDGGVVNGVCTPPLVCVVQDGSAIGKCEPAPASEPDAGGGYGGDGGGADAGDTFGLVEGGGCSCSSIGATSSPLGVFAALSGAITGVLVFLRRRNRNRK